MANIYDIQMREKIESWYGVGFTYKTNVVLGLEASVKKIYTNNRININMDAPLLEYAPYTRDRKLEPYQYTQDEAMAAKFRLVDRTGLPIERQLDSKYSGVEGTQDWRMWQIAIAETIPIKCKADYPLNKVEELISQKASLLRVDVTQSSTLTPFLRKRRSGQGPLLAFKVINSTCEITKIPKSR